MPVRKSQNSSGIAAASRNEQQKRRFEEFKTGDDDEEQEEEEDENWYLEQGSEDPGDINMTSSSNCSSRIRGSSISTKDGDSIKKRKLSSILGTPKKAFSRGAGDPGNKSQFQFQNKIAELMKKIPVCDQESKVIRLLLASKSPN